MKFATLMLIATLAVITLACSSSSAKTEELRWQQKPFWFRSSPIADDTFAITYTAPAGWNKQRSQEEFVFWNAMMAREGGSDCFILDDFHVSSRVDTPPPPEAYVSPGIEPLPSRGVRAQTLLLFDFAATARLGVGCDAPGAINAAGYIREHRPTRRQSRA